MNHPLRILMAFGNIFSWIHQAIVLGWRFYRSEAMRIVKSFCIGMTSDG
jgi:hypothetical protein